MHSSRVQMNISVSEAEKDRKQGIKENNKSSHDFFTSEHDFEGN